MKTTKVIWEYFPEHTKLTDYVENLPIGEYLVKFSFEGKNIRDGLLVIMKIQTGVMALIDNVLANYYKKHYLIAISKLDD